MLNQIHTVKLLSSSHTFSLTCLITIDLCCNERNYDVNRTQVTAHRFISIFRRLNPYIFAWWTVVICILLCGFSTPRIDISFYRFISNSFAFSFASVIVMMLFLWKYLKKKIFTIQLPSLCTVDHSNIPTSIECNTKICNTFQCV